MGLLPDFFFWYLLLISNVLSQHFYPRHLCHLNRKRQCDHPKPFSFYWEIKRPSPSPTAYLFGTIHVPYSKVWDSIPQMAKDAFNNSDRIIFELDLINQSMRRNLTKCQMLPTGIKLADIVPREMYQRLKQHLDYVKSKFPLWMSRHYSGNGYNEADHLFRAKTENWERKGPIWITIMLNSLTEYAIKTHGSQVLDLYLAQQALHQSKEVGSVERPRDQCVPLNRLNIEHAVFALNQTLLQHESIRLGTLNPEGSDTDELIKHYNCGNLNEVVFNQDFALLPSLKKRSHTQRELEISKQIDDYFRAQLIVNRNKRMSKQILKRLSSNPNESLFFVFGAGHFIGKDSIVEILQNSGLDIVHVTENRFPGHIECFSPYPNIRNSGIPPVSRIGNDNARPSINVNSRGNGLPHTSRATSGNIAANGWLGGARARTLLPRPKHPFSPKPVISRAMHPLSTAPYEGPVYSSPLLVSKSTTRHHLSFNDLLVRAHILNRNLQTASSTLDQHWPRVSSHLPPAYRTDADRYVSSSSPSADQQPYSWPLSSSTNAGYYLSVSPFILCFLSVQLLWTQERHPSL